MKALKRRIVFFGLLFFTMKGYGQQNDSAQYKEILQFFDAVAQVYKQASKLGFTAKYIYTDELQPKKVIDSLKGEYIINGQNYWFRIAQTETMKNDSLVIMLFDEDKMIYVRKAVQQAGFDPVDQMKNFLSAKQKVTSKIVRGKKYNELQIGFPAGMDYKSVNLTVEKSTGYLVKSVYFIRTTLLTDITDDKDADNANSFSDYARVEINYSDYHVDTSNSLFDENRFIRRSGKTITASEQYKNYKIFLGSSNL